MTGRTGAYPHRGEVRGAADRLRVTHRIFRRRVRKLVRSGENESEDERPPSLDADDRLDNCR